MPTDGERAVSLLTYASHSKVAKALQVSKTTVGKWARGRVTPYRLRQIEQLLRPDLQTAESAAPPWWGEAGKELKDEIRQNRTLIEEDAARKIGAEVARQVGAALRAHLQQPPVEASRTAQDQVDQDE